jgi:predicted acetyltransferase
MSVYVAYVDEQPASAAWIYFPKHSQFASLWGGSTIRSFRKRGLFTALLAVRAREAKARQARYLTVDASPMSRPILEKFGFERIAYSYPCKWKRDSHK